MPLIESEKKKKGKKIIKDDRKIAEHGVPIPEEDGAAARTVMRVLHTRGDGATSSTAMSRARSGGYTGKKIISVSSTSIHDYNIPSSLYYTQINASSVCPGLFTV